MTTFRLLHAIHDFLPRHRAGSEIYAFELCRELARRHHVTVLAAEYDLTRPHGHVTWRVQDGLAVVEIVNNWMCRSFEDTYAPASIAESLAHVLSAVQPDVVHVHSLLNLSFDLPSLARARGSAVVATLHDYTLVCPSGGQRVHRAENHLCNTIDPERCARCFPSSPFGAQMGVGRVVGATSGSAVRQVAGFLRTKAPGVAFALARLARRRAQPPISADDIDRRLERSRVVFDDVDLFVAPSQSIAREFERLGVDRSKICTSDYGFLPMERTSRARADSRLRIGYVGTLVWHKGVHVLIDAVRQLPSDAYEVVVHGDPAVDPDYTDDLRRRAQGLPIRFVGGFDRTSVAAVYAGVDVLVVPSIWPENSPLVIHEAFMAGVPVVGSRIGGTTELVTHGLNGLLYEPFSPDALAETLRGLVVDCIRLESLGRGVPPVKSIEADADEWEARYQAVVRPAQSRVHA